MSKQEDDVIVNPSDNPHLEAAVNKLLARRRVLKTGFGAAALPFFGVLAACGGDGNDTVAATSAPVAGPAPAPAPAPTQATVFKSVATSSGDTVVVPEGYSWKVVHKWGDPLTPAAPEWLGDASQDWRAQEQQVGDNHDGMTFFPFSNADGTLRADSGLLVVNHEYINPEYFYAPGSDATNWLNPFTFDKAKKAQAAHGATVAEIRRNADGSWSHVRSSPYNRRITGYTPMDISGPAAGHALLQTAADPAGREALGTLNNCANGATPWGTYLTCEENFNSYFGWNGTHTATVLENRYGLTASGSGYRWHEVDARFDINATPNEPNRFGWVVEIDPLSPNSRPKKRTALGRVKHENAEAVVAPNGRVVVYMGDDERNEYLYKFVTSGTYDRNNAAANRDLLDSGTLYVAKFEAGATAGDRAGTGQWIPLIFGQNGLDATNGFSSQADILVRTRQAADRVGATMLDRPEWVAANPRKTGEVFCTMTNNNRRGTTTASSNAAAGTTTAGSARPPVDEVNPRSVNNWGHIVRWNEANGDPTATAFTWDIFLLAGNPQAFPQPDPRGGSATIKAENMFNSPDGLAFDTKGRLWIQTDGSSSNTGDYAGQGNNQMLMADVATGEVRRFLVGPSGCEVTGLSWSPDLKTMFVNIQHPGELGGHPNAPRKADDTPYGDNDIAREPAKFSRFPDGAAATRPRSATIAIYRNDGGEIGT